MNEWHEGIHTLVFRSNRGCYALDDSEYGPDLSSGRHVDILLGGRWISGRVESALGICTELHGAVFGSYSFIADGIHEICGLCAGMNVRLAS